MNPGWSKIDTSMARPLSRDQKLRPMLEILAELREKYGRDADPVRTLLIMGMGLDPSPESLALLEQGGPSPIVPTNVQLEALKAVAQYVRPKLQNVQVTGVDEGPVKIDANIMQQVGTDERLLKAAEDFAIALATAENIPDSPEEEKA